MGKTSKWLAKSGKNSWVLDGKNRRKKTWKKQVLDRFFPTSWKNTLLRPKREHCDRDFCVLSNGYVWYKLCTQFIWYAFKSNN